MGGAVAGIPPARGRLWISSSTSTYSDSPPKSVELLSSVVSRFGSLFIITIIISIIIIIIITIIIIIIIIIIIRITIVICPSLFGSSFPRTWFRVLAAISVAFTSCYRCCSILVFHAVTLHPAVLYSLATLCRY